MMLQFYNKMKPPSQINAGYGYDIYIQLCVRTGVGINNKNILLGNVSRDFYGVAFLIEFHHLRTMSHTICILRLLLLQVFQYYCTFRFVLSSYNFGTGKNQYKHLPAPFRTPTRVRCVYESCCSRTCKQPADLLWTRISR